MQGFCMLLLSANGQFLWGITLSHKTLQAARPVSGSCMCRCLSRRPPHRLLGALRENGTGVCEGDKLPSDWKRNWYPVVQYRHRNTAHSQGSPSPLTRPGKTQEQRCYLESPMEVCVCHFCASNTSTQTPPVAERHIATSMSYRNSTRQGRKWARVKGTCSAGDGTWCKKRRLSYNPVMLYKETNIEILCVFTRRAFQRAVRYHVSSDTCS